PREHWDRMDAAFGGLFARLFQGGGADPALAANVKRGPVICYRIAVVLAVWRAYGEGVDLQEAESLTIRADDAEAALLLALVYVENALLQAADLSRRFTVRDGFGLDGADRMTARDRAFLGALPQQFDRRALNVAADTAGISQATAYRRIEKWTDAGLIRKDGQGSYEKVENAAKAEKTAPADSDTQAGFSHGSQVSQLSHGDGVPGEPPSLALVTAPAPEDTHPLVGRTVGTPQGVGVVRQVFDRSVRVEVAGRLEHVDPADVVPDPF
ncbi:MAG TPA: Lrp/AsnC family transcriptional regulator, partial [Rhodothermales bacterium]|nr:Lrp/AsnC family transcriptional regulator [Rhodothermales bacterium]